MAHAVVGLGNPGSEYAETRHNVGHRVVDLLASRLHARWRRLGKSRLAEGDWNGERLFLVKPNSFMNVTGPVLAASLRELGLSPSDVVLVYDDIDLPLGTVRVRMKGSHGGHRGVRSVIETLGTSDIRRVKVGIGRPATKAHVPDHVLAPFERDEIPIVSEAVTEAAEKVLALLEAPATGRTDP